MSVLCLLPVLAHHDKGSLNGGNAGKYQIQKDKWVGIKGLRSKDNVDSHPSDHDSDKAEDKCPASGKFRYCVGCSLAEGQLFCLIGIFCDVCHDQLMDQLFICKFLVSPVQEFPDDFFSFVSAFHFHSESPYVRHIKCVQRIGDACGHCSILITGN